MWNCPLNRTKNKTRELQVRNTADTGGDLGGKSQWGWSSGSNEKVLIKRKKRFKLPSVPKHCGESLWSAVLKHTPTSISLSLLFSNQGPNTPRSGAASDFTHPALRVDVGLLDWELSSPVGRGRWLCSLSRNARYKATRTELSYLTSCKDPSPHTTPWKFWQTKT